MPCHLIHKCIPHTEGLLHVSRVITDIYCTRMVLFVHERFSVSGQTLKTNSLSAIYEGHQETDMQYCKTPILRMLEIFALFASSRKRKNYKHAKNGK